MAMRRVARHVYKTLLEAVEDIRKDFAGPPIGKVQNVLKHEAEIAKMGRLAKHKLKLLKYEYNLHQKLSAEYRAKHGATDEFKAVVVGSAVVAYAWHMWLQHASLETLRKENRMQRQKAHHNSLLREKAH